MASLLKLPQLRSSNDTKGLRRLYDQIKAHIRGLKFSEVSDTAYGALLLPILISKIPDDIRILLGRRMPGSLMRNWKTYARNWKTEKDGKRVKLCRLETFEIPMNRNEGDESLIVAQRRR